MDMVQVNEGFEGKKYAHPKFSVCMGCDKPLSFGEKYYAFELGKFKVVESKDKEEPFETESIFVTELVVYCEKCYHEIYSMIK